MQRNVPQTESELKTEAAPDHGAFHSGTEHPCTESETRLHMERALVELQSQSPQAARLLELYYSKRLPLPKIATVLDLPPARVAIELRFVKAWLRSRTRRQPGV